MTSPTVLWTPNKIVDGTYAKLARRIIAASEPIYLVCFGYGGDAAEAAGVVSAVLGHGNVTGVLVGECSSAHAYIFAACQRRYAYPQSKIAIHPIRINLNGLFTAAELHRYFENIEKMDADVINLLARSSNMSVKLWSELYYSSPEVYTEIWEQDLYQFGLAAPVTDEVKRAISQFFAERKTKKPDGG